MRIREIRVHKSIPWILRETSKFILRILCGGNGPFGRTKARPYVSIRAISVTKCDPTLFWRIVGYFGLLSENPGGDVGEDFGGDCLLYFAVVEAFFGIGTLLEHVVHAWVFLGGDRF